MYRIKSNRVKRRYERKWLGISGITAIGVGNIDDKIGIIVSVDTHTDITSVKIPAQVEGVPVKIIPVGKLRAF
jgi:hypothetical protein